MAEIDIVMKGGIVLLEVYVVPRASRAGVVGVHGGILKVALLAPPVEGATNAALVALLAKRLGLDRRDVSIVAGLKSRHKRVALAGARPEDVRQLAAGR